MNVLLRPGEDAREGFRELTDLTLEAWVFGTVRLEDRHEDRMDGSLLVHPVFRILILWKLSQSNPRPPGRGGENLRGGVGELGRPRGLNPFAIGQHNLHIKNRHVDHRFILDEEASSRRRR